MVKCMAPQKEAILLVQGAYAVEAARPEIDLLSLLPHRLLLKHFILLGGKFK
jgi:hypothetical protein